jgi:hypothetical protein
MHIYPTVETIPYTILALKSSTSPVQRKGGDIYNTSHENMSKCMLMTAQYGPQMKYQNSVATARRVVEGW